MKADVSIIITNFNKPFNLITECFDSIREQTWKPREIILVDDGSEKPMAHVDALSILLSKNVGVSKARDIGVHNAQGSLLLFLDSDDRIPPDFIQQSMYAIQTHEIAYPNHVLFGEVEENRLVEPPEELRPEDFIGSENGIVTMKLVVSSMMHRRVYENLQGFRDLQVYEDWDFWIRAMCKGYTFRKAHTFLWYRQSKTSRNNISSGLRADVYREITAPYEISGGKICLKMSDSK